MRSVELHEKINIQAGLGVLFSVKKEKTKPIFRFRINQFGFC